MTSQMGTRRWGTCAWEASKLWQLMPSVMGRWSLWNGYSDWSWRVRWRASSAMWLATNRWRSMERSCWIWSALLEAFANFISVYSRILSNVGLLVINNHFMGCGACVEANTSQPLSLHQPEAILSRLLDRYLSRTQTPAQDQFHNHSFS